MLTNGVKCIMLCVMSIDKDKQTRCALYCRVSRLLGQSVQNQITPLTEFANNRGYRIVGTYSDEGQSGGKTKRPQLDAMLRDAKAGKFDVLLVAALDRLGRDLRHLLSLLDELGGLGVQFISLRENIDLTQSHGRLLMSLIGSICEYERSLIRTRIREALAAKRLLAEKTGTRFAIGRPSQLNDELIRRIVDLRSEGLSIRAIEAAINKQVSRGSIERVLKAHRDGCHENLGKFASKNKVISMGESAESAKSSDPEKTTDIVTPLTAKGGRR